MLERQLESILRDNVWKKVLLVNNFLNEQGYKIAVSQTINLYEILLTYLLLKKANELSVDEIIDVTMSVYTNIKWNDELIDKLYKYLSGKSKYPLYLTERSIQKISSKIRFGKEISIRKIFEGRLSKSDVETYVLFRKTGIIRKDRYGRLKAVKYNEYKRLSRKLYEDTVSLNDIMMYADEIPTQLWSLLITDERLEEADLKQLIDIADRLRSSSNVSLKRKVLDKIANNIDVADRLRSWEKKVIASLVRETGYTNLNLLVKVWDKLGIDRLRTFGIDEIISMIKTIPLQDRQKIVSRIVKKASSRDIDKLLNSLDLISFKSSSYSMDPRIKSVYNLANALSNYIDYMITYDKSFLEYSSYFSDKVDPRYLPHRFRPIYESIINMDQRIFLTKAILHEYPSLLEYVLTRAISLRSLGYSNDVINRALHLGLRILRYIVGKVHKSSRKVKVTYRSSKIDLRGTIYNVIRLNYEERYFDWKKEPNIIVLLDTSGSMFNHSLWAICSLATFIYRINYVLLFSENVDIVRIRRHSTHLLYKFLKSIIEHGFKGYTNIELALSKALSLARKKTFYILISDLKQTVKGNPLKPIGELLKRGHKLLVIAPQNYDRELAHSIESLGGNVIIVKSPFDIPYVFRRKLSLKSNFLKGG